MENLNQDKKSPRVWAGLAIVIIGFVFLLDNIGLSIPNWVFGWYTILIVLGLFIGAKNNFSGSKWLILVGVGLFFNLKALPFFDFNLSKYTVGIGLVAIGIYLIVKPKNFYGNRYKGSTIPNDPLNPNAGMASESVNVNDVIHVVAVFGGTNQTVYSKNFKGGDVTAAFGGADINFVQADFNGNVFLDVTAMFGGIKLVIPQNWAVKSNVTAVFGSVEDRRAQSVSFETAEKTLILDGVALFGGVEIKSF